MKYFWVLKPDNLQGNYFISSDQKLIESQYFWGITDDQLMFLLTVI